MANPHRTVTIELDRPRPFRLDFNAYAELEAAFGIEWTDAYTLLRKASGVKKVVWLGLRAGDPGFDLTEDEVAGYLDTDWYVAHRDRLWQAMGLSLPEPEPAAEGDGGNAPGPRQADPGAGARPSGLPTATSALIPTPSGV